MKLVVVIVNYKTAEMTLESVDALLPELAPYPDARVTIVDNDSQDGSFDKMKAGVVERGIGDRVKVMASERNGGFAYGVNWGARDALESDEPPDYIYLLNSDAFTDEGSVKALVQLMDGHPQAGIAVSYIHGVAGTPHQTAFRFPSVFSEFEKTIGIGLVSKALEPWIVALPMPAETLEVDWLAGASMLIRREVFERIGYFDDTYFLYFEETDFCRRAKLAGFPTYYGVESSVAHVGSASTGLKDQSRPTPPYWFASRRHYFLKNHGRPYLWTSNAVYVTGMSLRKLRAKLTRQPEKVPAFEGPNHLRDFIRHLRP
ncbi:MAG: glycosyltransferase family 2 protein [Myxococcales bacterium]|nr:glycosyltransferase family 2 protein [Myxococcales bacterium]